MSITAQSRDLSDPKTIESFARVVQTMERLKLLLVLTIADIKAVGPGVWTGWKGGPCAPSFTRPRVCSGAGHPRLRARAGAGGRQPSRRPPCRVGPGATF